MPIRLGKFYESAEDFLDRPVTEKERERLAVGTPAYQDYWGRKKESTFGGQVFGGVQPQPRYKPAFYEQLGALPGSRPYLDWFQSRFPGLVSEFESKLPTYKGFKTSGRAFEEAGKIESQWSEWLKSKTAELRERWWSKRPEERGEKPWAYQSMVRTRSF